MKDNIDYSVYAITDRYWHKDRPIEEMIEESIKGGATIIQLREKHISDDEFLSLALKSKKVCNKYNIPLIINDNIDVMLKSDADGIHAGQSDLNAKKVRELIGPNKILGVSVGNVEEAKIAIENGADYLGVGAIFPTNTKDDAILVSLDELRNISLSVDIPVVAIGGIHLDTIKELKNTCINGVAVISEIFSKDDILKATKILKSEVDKIILNLNDYDLYVFDYDGTLLNSMKEWATMSSSFVKSHNIIPSDDLDSIVYNMNTLEASTYIHNTYSIGNSPEECYHMIIDYIYKVYKDIKLKDGALKLLKTLEHLNKKIIILSQTELSLIKMSIENNKISDYFDEIYSTEAINATKGDGSAFRKIKEMYPNNKILIIEDAYYAIKMAKLANLNVMSVIDDSNLNDLNKIISLSDYYGSLNWMVK